jgi:hypothetical protein
MMGEILVKMQSMRPGREAAGEKKYGAKVKRIQSPRLDGVLSDSAGETGI